MSKASLLVRPWKPVSPLAPTSAPRLAREILRLRRSFRRLQRQHDLGGGTSRRQHYGPRLPARGPPAVQPRKRRAGVRYLLKSYRVTKVSGDRYAGEWPREQFRKLGIEYEPAEQSKSDLYRDLLPQLNSKQLDLLDHPRLLNQFVSLERRTSRGGRDSIDHPPGAHDDLSNACAGVVGLLAKPRGFDRSLRWVASDSELNANAAWRRRQYVSYVHSGGLFR